MKSNVMSLSLFVFFGCLILFPIISSATGTEAAFTLQQTIVKALQVNIGLKSSQEEIKAAGAIKNAQRTYFFPTFGATYRYVRNDEELILPGVGTISTQNEFHLSTTVTQPLFAGFSLLKQYEIANLGLDAALINEKLTTQNIIFNAKTTYFLLLKAQKLRNIAMDTVTQLEAHREVADNFYQVGMIPLNDLLQAEVELANAKQEFLVAKNNLDNAEANFNVLLRRPINATVEIKDIVDYTPFEKNLDYCFKEAEKNRLEFKITDLDIQIAEIKLALVKKDYYPSVNLLGTYLQQGEEWNARGGLGVFGDSSGWTVSVVASWDFWEWGRTNFRKKEQLSRVSQAKLRKTEISNNIRLEAKKAYLTTQEAEKAIVTIEKAIQQAKENFRISNERYEEQMNTSTDVLDAQTLLSRTMANYYNALYAFKISKASLYRAIGQEIME
ncbi:MAG: TolC family protein [Desulfobacterales bacterium]|nr:TolC family protein [Desulfobacterales bacterium]